MRYWDQMEGKYGFDGGNATPEGIEYYRDVYVKFINARAAARNSNVRVVPFDCHSGNFCATELVSKDWFEKEYLPAQPKEGLWRATDNCAKVVGDQAFDEAVSDASAFDLDQFVSVQVSIVPEFEQFMKDQM